MPPPGVLALLAGKMGFLCQHGRAAGRGTVGSAAWDLARRRYLPAEEDPGRTPFRGASFPTERMDTHP